MPGQPAPPDPDNDRLTVELEGVGFQPNRILSYRINTQYTTPTDAWEFVVYSEDDPRGLRRRFRPLQPIKLYIAGNQQVIGRIDKIEGFGESGAALKVSGRDYLADLVDSTVDPQFQVKKSQDIGAFLLDLLKPWGITTVFGNFNLTRNAMSGRKPFTKDPAKHYKSAKLEDTKASENEGVFEFANKVVARHSFMILPAGTRDSIVVDAPNYEQSPLYSVSRPGNILSGTASRDYTDIPTVTIAHGRTGGSDPGKQSPSSLKQYPTYDKSGPSKIGGVLEVQHAITSDDGIVVVREKQFDAKKRDNTVFGFDFPVYKPLFYRDRDSRNDEELDYSVRRVIAEKLRNTLTYNCTVRGHVEPKSGATWAVDTLVNVHDEIEDVSETMWILERTFENDGTSGPVTHLSLVRPGSFVW
jgi:prophage tail gpP-like protein